MTEKEKSKPKSKDDRPCTRFAEAELPRITANLHYFLEEHDSSYLKKIDVIVSHTTPGNYFKVRVLPVNGFDTQQYFKDNFGEMPAKGELEQFAEENCIGAFVHGTDGVATNVDRINRLK
jgi:hypothetical protein